MRQRLTVPGLVSAIALMSLVGCRRSDTLAEGVIYSVEYLLPNGGTEGFTRLNNSRAIPGGSGSWNVDAYGRLTHDFLIITRPQQAESGSEFIPVSRLVSVRFGDGGIPQVDKQANPGK